MSLPGAARTDTFGGAWTRHSGAAVKIARAVLARRLALPLLLALHGVAAHAQPAAAAPAASPEVVVTAGRGILPREMPLEQLSDVEVAGLGVDSASELLTQLKPRTVSSMSTQDPIVLVNGRVAGSTELDNLAPEAILRVDILPETSALRYGFDDTQKVVNIILRDHYRGGTAGVSDRQATDGGGRNSTADVVATRVEQDAEVSARLDYQDSARLLESERGIAAPDSDFRTLLPGSRETKLGAVVVRPVLAMRPSLEASVDVKSSDALQGLADGAAASAAGPPSQVTQHMGSTAVHLGGRVTGPLGRLIWSVALTGNESRSQQRVAAAGPAGGLLDGGDYTLDSGRLDASLGGPVLHLPAGPLTLNTHADAQLDVIRTHDQLPGEAPQANRLSRTTGSAQMRARVPLTSPGQDVLAWAGELTVRASLGADAISQLGTLVSDGYGLSWSPADHVYFNADQTDTRLAPTMQDLRGPVVSTPGVPLFDFVTGETDYVTQVTGGNPRLAPTDRRAIRLGVYLGTFAGDSSFYANYERRRDRNAVGPLPPLTATVETAFPERFIRDAAGTVVEADERAVNLAGLARDVMTWGINLGLPFATAGDGPRPQGPHLMLSLQDSWYLHDTVRVGGGVPELDLLGGAPLSATGGTVAGAQPQHSLQLWANLYYRALGAQLSGRWHSAVHVDGGTLAVPQDLRFPALATLSLRVFADVGRLLGSSAGSWVKGLRVSAAVSNLLAARQRVIDASGLTPVGFEPGYLDPLGRAVTVSVRKAF
jgi:hypothetical protein